WEAISGRPVPAEPTTAEKLDIIRRYFALMIDTRGEHYAMFQIRRRMSWFGKRLGQELDHRGRPVGCRPLKEAVRTAKSPAEVLDHLAEFQAGGLRGGMEVGDVGVEADSATR
ncbi:MAG TPA: hypothetical protein VEB59_05635, partial [Gemmatimonadales bacterium]|nr:hypothetical protein [Gemmatimonadales bacterium]